MKLALIIPAIFLLFLILDLIWFSVAGNFFKNEIGQIARLTSNGSWNVLYAPALLAYILMTLGLIVFVLPNSNNITEATMLGAVFGFVIYGVYDMTNLATLEDWTVKFAIVDMLWGTFLYATVTSIVYWFFY